MKRSASTITRRVFGSMLGGAVLSLAARASDAVRLTWDEPVGPVHTVTRHYRADAQILVLSVPLVHRSGVGGGSATWRESHEPGGNLLRFLEFNGFSLPARASGLNRLGFIREKSRLSDGKSLESIYFGLMTASPEESAEQARRSIDAKAKEQVYTAIDGHIAPGSVQTIVAHFPAPSTLSGEQRPELIERARQALTGAPQSAPGLMADRGDLPTFLQALAEMLRRPDRNESAYLYGGRVYSLWTNRIPDPKASAYFEERRLIKSGAVVIRVSGRLRRQAGGKDTEFRVWIEQGAEQPVPLRIEYRAKSYLRLVFEADGA